MDRPQAQAQAHRHSITGGMDAQQFEDELLAALEEGSKDEEVGRSTLNTVRNTLISSATHN